MRGEVMEYARSLKRQNRAESVNSLRRRMDFLKPAKRNFDATNWGAFLFSVSFSVSRVALARPDLKRDKIAAQKAETTGSACESPAQALVVRPK